MSKRRWKEQDLDNHVNFDKACEHLSAVITVFEYLNHPDVLRGIEETGSKVSTQMGKVDVTYRLRLGVFTALRMTQLWEQFYPTHWGSVAAAAHDFVHSHVQ